MATRTNVHRRAGRIKKVKPRIANTPKVTASEHVAAVAIFIPTRDRERHLRITAKNYGSELPKVRRAWGRAIKAPIIDLRELASLPWEAALHVLQLAREMTSRAAAVEQLGAQDGERIHRATLLAQADILRNDRGAHSEHKDPAGATIANLVQGRDPRHDATVDLAVAAIRAIDDPVAKAKALDRLKKQLNFLGVGVETRRAVVKQVKAPATAHDEPVVTPLSGILALGEVPERCAHLVLPTGYKVAADGSLYSPAKGEAAMGPLVSLRFAIPVGKRVDREGNAVSWDVLVRVPGDDGNAAMWHEVQIVASHFNDARGLLRYHARGLPVDQETGKELAHFFVAFITDNEPRLRDREKIT